MIPEDLPAVFGTTSALSCKYINKGTMRGTLKQAVACCQTFLAVLLRIPLTSKVTRPRCSLSAAMSKYTVGFLLAVAAPLLYRRAAVNATEQNFTRFDKSNIVATAAGLRRRSHTTSTRRAYVTNQEEFVSVTQEVPPPELVKRRHFFSRSIARFHVI